MDQAAGIALVMRRSLHLLVFIGIIVLAGLLVLSVSGPRKVSVTQDLTAELPKGETSGEYKVAAENELGWRLSLGALLRRLRMLGIFFINVFKNKTLYFILLLFGFLGGAVTWIRKKAVFQKKYGFWAVFGVILAVIVAWVFFLFSKKIVVYNSYINTSPAGEIYGEKKIGQTFKAQYDDLSAVDVLMATYQRDITGQIIFHLKKDVGASEDLSQKKVDAEKIRDNRYFRFRFPEIEDSKGKNYYFCFEAPEAKPGNALTIWANDDDKYFEGERIINGEAAQGDLIFKTVYDKILREKAELFLSEITRAKPFPLNKKWFYIGFIGLFFLGCSLYLTYLIKVFDEQRK
ncbi:MAG: hypothetical protein WBC70_16575 [Candidatus Aminicenantales bacterium]